jgi:protein-S-isoprenylcysteine O-methyltransferase Ste14
MIEESPITIFGITVEFFLFLYLVIALILFILRGTYVLRTGLGKRTVNEPLDRALFVLTTIFMFFVPAVYALWNSVPSLEYDVPQSLSWLGLMVLIVAFMIIWRAHADLGRSFAIAPGWMGGHVLVTKGIYSMVRHPMYLGLLLWSVGMPLVVTNVAIGLPLLPIELIFCLNRIPLE